jgi:hypothetical protein
MGNQTINLIVVIFVWSCSASHTKEQLTEIDSIAAATEFGFDANTFESYLRLENYLAGAAVPEGELQVVSSSCAILVNPTAERLLEMTEDYGEDNLVTIIDDQGYFQSNARQILDWASISIVEAEKRFIKCSGENHKTWVLDTRKEGAPAWNIILFNSRKEPEPIPATDLTWNKVAQFFELSSPQAGQ